MVVETPALSVVELTVRDGALSYDVAGDTERSPYERSGLLLVQGDSSDGSPNTSCEEVLTRLIGRRAARPLGSVGGSVVTRTIRCMPI